MATNATFCDFLVRGVRLDAKDHNKSSDPYIVIKIPTTQNQLFVPKQIITEIKTNTSEIVTNVTNQITDQVSNQVSDTISNAITNKMANKMGNITNNVAQTVVSNMSSSVTQQVISSMVPGQQNSSVNAQGSIKTQVAQSVKGQVVQTVKGQALQTAATTITHTAGAIVSTNVGSIVVVALLTNAAYTYARKTHASTEGYAQIFETDVVMGNLNPSWKPFRLGLFELCHGNLDMEILIECYDYDRFKPSDLIGSVKVPVRTLVSATDELGLRLVSGKQATAGTLYVQCKPSVSSIVYCDLHASATDLDRKDLFGLSDPYFVIKVPEASAVVEQPSSFGSTMSGITIPKTIERCGIQNHSISKGLGEVFESHVIRKTLNPEWGECRIGFYELCRGDPDQNIRIQCYDYNRFLPSSKIGSAEVSIRTLIEAEGPVAISLTRGKKKKVTGTFVLHCVPSSPLPSITAPHPATLFVRKAPPRVIPRSFGPPPYSDVSNFTTFSPSSPTYNPKNPKITCVDSPAVSSNAPPRPPSIYTPTTPEDEFADECSSLTISEAPPAPPRSHSPPSRPPPRAVRSSLTISSSSTTTTTTTINTSTPQASLPPTAISQTTTSQTTTSQTAISQDAILQTATTQTSTSQTTLPQITLPLPQTLHKQITTPSVPPQASLTTPSRPHSKSAPPKRLPPPPPSTSSRSSTSFVTPSPSPFTPSSSPFTPSVTPSTSSTLKVIPARPPSRTPPPPPPRAQLPAM